MAEKKVAFSDSNRIGKFNMLTEILQDGRERPMLQALMGLCVILEAFDHESGRGKTYIAASDLFQPLVEGEEIPEYRIEVAWPDRDFPNPERNTECLHSGQFRFAAIRQNIVRVPPLSVNFNAGQPGRMH